MIIIYLTLNFKLRIIKKITFYDLKTLNKN